MKTLYKVFLTLALYYVSCSTDDALVEEVTISCSNVYEGDVVLRTQHELDAFGAMGYDCIDGNLTITVIFDEDIFDDDDPNEEDPILNLGALSSLVSVSGDVAVAETKLISLDGLENLEMVGGELGIARNDDLISIEGFSGIQSQVSSLTVFNNLALTSLNGLDNLRFMENANLTLEGNDSLLDASALEDSFPLEMGRIFIRDRDVCLDLCNPLEEYVIPFPQPLSDFSFLQSAYSIRFLRLQAYMENNLLGLQGVDGIRSLWITYCPNLESFEGLSITSPMIGLYIDTCHDLTTLDGAEGIPYISGAISIVGNNALSDYCGLENSFQGVEPDSFNVNSNAYNPTQQDIINGNCSL